MFIAIGFHAAAAMRADSLQPAAGASPSIGDTLWTDIQSAGTDALRLFSAPSRFTLRDWGVVGWVAAGTGMSMAADDPVRTFFQNRQGTAGNAIADIGTFYGNGIPTLGISAALYGGGLIFDNPGVRRAGLYVFESALYAGAITTTVKVLAGRHRPYLNDGPFAYHGPTFRDEFNSIPSGHTTMAFALGSSLACDIDNPWATVGLYSAAALTGLTRIYKDRHWLSDVFLGAAVGTACGYGVHHLNPDSVAGATGFYIGPTLDGVMVSYVF